MCLVKDFVESKTMIITLVFIMSISLIGGITNNDINLASDNNTNIVL